MSATIDDSGRVLDPEAEVRKLQKLVARLTEERNQYLKNNTNHKLQNTELSGNIDGYTENNKDKLKGIADISLDDVELLDVTQLDSQDEEDSWLYRSPKKLSPSQQEINTYKWLREEFDSPSPQLEAARKSLLLRLDELSRFARSPSTGSLGSPVSSVSDVPSPQNLRNVASTGCMPSIRQPLLGLGANKIDTSTFTRPKKKQIIMQNKNQVGNNHDRSSQRNTPERTDSNHSVNISSYDTPERNNNQESLENCAGIDENANGQLSTSGNGQENLRTTHKLNDVTDVQILAKMQEESLRQSMNSPYLSRRKSFSENNPDDLDLDTYDPDCDPALSHSFSNSKGDPHCGIDNYNSTSLGSDRSSPAYFDSELQAKRSNNSLASLSSHSNSPTSSPYGSQYLDQKMQAVLNDNHGHRRSMPNLSRGMPGGFQLPKHGSDSSLGERNTPSPSYHGQKPARTQTYRVSPNRQVDACKIQSNDSLSRTLSPNRGASPQRTLSSQRTISPQRSKIQKNISPGRTASPQRSGIPGMSRTGIPRPGTVSKLPMPRRSSIPSVRRSLATPRTNDESWKDGCY